MFGCHAEEGKYTHERGWGCGLEVRRVSLSMLCVVCFIHVAVCVCVCVGREYDYLASGCVVFRNGYGSES